LQEECWWDCNIDRAVLELTPLYFGVTVVSPNLTCLRDCFSTNKSSSDYCITSLLEDVIARGVCDLGLPEELTFWGLNQTCNIASNPTAAQTINSGTCSEETESLLKTIRCQKAILEQDELIRVTLAMMILFSCTKYPFDNDGILRDTTRPTSNSSRLAPVNLVFDDPGQSYATELDYTHTRHRYPWICSLRTRGANPEHLCAVTLLSVPPGPTAIVGPAHCTYLCRNRDANGVRLPTCCCVDRTLSLDGQKSCRDDPMRCGSQPVAVRIDGSGELILCGEWETGAAPQGVSGEEYNLVLPILEIVRHPDFDEDAKGVGEGSDVVVFKVDDSDFQNTRALNIYPACLPPRNRQPTAGVQSGWSSAPPYAFLLEYGPGFTNNYRNFFKQWHYSMEIMDTCRDPTFSFYANANILPTASTHLEPSVRKMSLDCRALLEGSQAPPLWSGKRRGQ
jgi:hypothetical protein